MANIKATTPIKLPAYALIGLGVLLIAFAGVNLFYTFTPAAALNLQIEAELKPALMLPQDQKLPVLNDLKTKQGAALKTRPSEPYGWARLSYLRAATGEGANEAFAALQASDMVSPFEVNLLPERATAWRNFRNIETKEQKDYQDTLWQHAFTVANQATWDLAVRENLVAEVRDALMRKDKELASGWTGKMSDAGM